MKLEAENAYREAQWVLDDAYAVMERVKNLVSQGDLPIEVYRNACASVVAARDVKQSIAKRRNLAENARTRGDYHAG